MGRGTSSYPYMPTAETESSQAKAHKASRIGIAHSSTCHDSRVPVAESFSCVDKKQRENNNATISIIFIRKRKRKKNPFL